MSPKAGTMPGAASWSGHHDPGPVPAYLGDLKPTPSMTNQSDNLTTCELQSETFQLMAHGCMNKAKVCRVKGKGTAQIDSNIEMPALVLCA